MLQSFWSTLRGFFTQGSAGNNSDPFCLQQTDTRTTLTQNQKFDLITSKQWMYAGYPYFTKWMASSHEGVVLRRFDEMHARVLLKMQNDIVSQERLLHKIDADHMKLDINAQHNNGSFRNDEWIRGKEPNSPLGKRTTILDNLEDKLYKYDKMVINYRQLRSDPEPPNVVVQNVRRYLESRGHWPEDERGSDPSRCNQGPISDAESAFIYQNGDLLTLVSEEKQPLRRFLESKDWFMLGRLFRKSSHPKEQYTDVFGTTVYQSDKKINFFITGSTLLLGWALLVVPLQVLDGLNSQKQRLWVICSLITGFMFVMALVMPAKPWETLAASAAYSAVLMVFLQIGVNGNNCT